MKRSIIVFTSLVVGLSLFSSCKKVEGPGGTAAIRGKVMGSTVDQVKPGDAEIINVTVKNGADIEHGEYWLLNGPTNGELYYIWYNNPTWVSNGDPQLQGRTGIQVDFNYSDDNVTIAMNTVAALNNAVTNDFVVDVYGDIITLTSKINQDLVDADNGNMSFNVDIANQGDTDILIPSSSISIVDERVYLIYGAGEVFNESAHTGADGVFTFDGLNPGKYRVYALSTDVNTGEKFPVYKFIEITEKGTVADAGTIEVIIE
jgi:hypothetical protein